MLIILRGFDAVSYPLGLKLLCANLPSQVLGFLNTGARPAFSLGWVWTRMGISAVEMTWLFVVKMSPPGRELNPQVFKVSLFKERSRRLNNT